MTKNSYTNLLFILCFFGSMSLTAQTGVQYRDTLLAGISANGVQIIFVDTFTTTSLDLTGTPRNLTQWTKSNQSGTPANPTHSSVAITTAHDLNNNSPIMTGTLAYNTTYYVLVDGVNAADCQYRLQVETLVDAVVQTSPCVVQSPTLMPVDFHTLQIKCNNSNPTLEWKLEEKPISPILIEKSLDGSSWENYQSLPNHHNFFNILPQKHYITKSF